MKHLNTTHTHTHTPKKDREKELLVKILSEEVSFKTNSEGRERWKGNNPGGLQQRNRRQDHYAVFFRRLGCEQFCRRRKNADSDVEGT